LLSFVARLTPFVAQMTVRRLFGPSVGSHIKDTKEEHEEHK